jgi:hypothetical protein
VLQSAARAFARDGVVGDLLRTIETIYASCDREFDDRARNAVAACVSANPKGQFGTHGYRLEDFGLHADAFRERFAGYVERYGIPAEASAASTH